MGKISAKQKEQLRLHRNELAAEKSRLMAAGDRGTERLKYLSHEIYMANKAMNPEKTHLIHNRWNHERKRTIIEMLGGKCAECGGVFEPAQYHVHHKDPAKKEFEIAKMMKSGVDLNSKEFKAELKKCELLCANCHTEKHFNARTKTISSKAAKTRKVKAALVDEFGACTCCGKKSPSTLLFRVKEFLKDGPVFVSGKYGIGDVTGARKMAKRGPVVCRNCNALIKSRRITALELKAEMAASKGRKARTPNRVLAAGVAVLK